MLGLFFVIVFIVNVNDQFSSIQINMQTLFLALFATFKLILLNCKNYKPSLVLYLKILIILYIIITILINNSLSANFCLMFNYNTVISSSLVVLNNYF